MKQPLWMEKLQQIDRKVLYLMLILATAIPLFIKGLVIPVKIEDSTGALFVKLNSLPEGSVVVIQSDWTVSSRGESAGQLEALLRILRSRKSKFVLFSAADPQAPQVARNVIRRVNKEFPDGGFKPWQDYVDLKYFPQAESFASSMASDLRKAWDRTMIDPADGRSKSVFESPVLKGVRRLEDLQLYTIVTASGTPRIVIQRFGSPSRVPIAALVTGVMGPEHMNYFAAGQLIGMSNGLRGVVELETMMVEGVNHRVDGKASKAEYKRFNGSIPPLEGAQYKRGMQYFASLHTALIMLIILVILGNMGIFTKWFRKGDA